MMNQTHLNINEEENGLALISQRYVNLIKMLNLFVDQFVDDSSG